MGQVADKQLRLTTAFSGLLSGEVEAKTAFAILDTHTHTHASLSSIGTDDHHAKLHASTHSKDGVDQVTVENLHTAATNTAYVLRPAGGNTLAFSQLAHSSLASIGVNDHHNRDHSSTHSENQADQIAVENLGAISTNTTLVLKPDGTGGVSFVAEGGGSGLWTQAGSDIYYSTGDVWIGISTGGSARLDVQEAIDSDRLMLNLKNTSAGSSAGSKLTIETAGAGDAYVEFKVAAQSWSIGIDNSDSDRLSICNTPSITQVNRFVAVTTTGIFEVGRVGSSTGKGSIYAYGDNAYAGGLLRVYSGQTISGNSWSLFAGLQNDTHEDALKIGRPSAEVAEITDLGNIGVTGYHTKYGSRLHWTSGWSPLQWANASPPRGRTFETPGIAWDNAAEDVNYIWQHRWHNSYRTWTAAGSMSAPYAQYRNNGTLYFDDDTIYMGGGTNAFVSVTTNRGTAEAPQSYMTERLDVYDMGTPDYNSGWFAVANANLYTKAHGLSTSIDTSLIFVEWCANNTGGGYRMDCLGTNFDHTSSGIQCGLVKVDGTNLYIRTGATYTAGYVNLANAGTLVAAGYCRVRAWNITPDYDSVSWYNTSVNTQLYFHHNLNSEYYYIQPMITESGTGWRSGNYGLVGSQLQSSDGLQINDIFDTKVGIRCSTVFGRFIDTGGTKQNISAGLWYTRMLCWK